MGLRGIFDQTLFHKSQYDPPLVRRGIFLFSDALSRLFLYIDLILFQ